MHLPQGEAELLAMQASSSEAVRLATRGRCTVESVRRSDVELTVRLHMEQESIDLIARPQEGREPAFRTLAGCCFVYRSEEGHHLTRRANAILSVAIDATARDVATSIVAA